MSLPPSFFTLQSSIMSALPTSGISMTLKPTTQSTGPIIKIDNNATDPDALRKNIRSPDNPQLLKKFESLEEVISRLRKATSAKADKKSVDEEIDGLRIKVAARTLISTSPRKDNIGVQSVPLQVFPIGQPDRYHLRMMDANLPSSEIGLYRRYFPSKEPKNRMSTLSSSIQQREVKEEQKQPQGLWRTTPRKRSLTLKNNKNVERFEPNLEPNDLIKRRQGDKKRKINTIPDPTGSSESSDKMRRTDRRNDKMRPDKYIYAPPMKTKIEYRGKNPDITTTEVTEQEVVPTTSSTNDDLKEAYSDHGQSASLNQEIALDYLDEEAPRASSMNDGAENLIGSHTNERESSFSSFFEQMAQGISANPFLVPQEQNITQRIAEPLKGREPENVVEDEKDSEFILLRLESETDFMLVMKFVMTRKIKIFALWKGSRLNEFFRRISNNLANRFPSSDYGNENYAIFEDSSEVLRLIKKFIMENGLHNKMQIFSTSLDSNYATRRMAEGAGGAGIAGRAQNVPHPPTQQKTAEYEYEEVLTTSSTINDLMKANSNHRQSSSPPDQENAPEYGDREAPAKSFINDAEGNSINSNSNERESTRRTARDVSAFLFSVPHTQAPRSFPIVRGPDDFRISYRDFIGRIYNFEYYETRADGTILYECITHSDIHCGVTIKVFGDKFERDPTKRHKKECFERSFEQLSSLRIG